LPNRTDAPPKTALRTPPQLNVTSSTESAGVSDPAGVALDETFVFCFTKDGAEQCVGVLGLGGPIVTEHGRVPATYLVRFEVAQLHLAQARHDQALEELGVFLAGARSEVAFGEVAAGESGQEVEFGSLVVLLLRGTPVTTGDLSVDFGQPVLPLEAGQERVRRLVPTPVGAHIAGPEGICAPFDAAEGPPLVWHWTPPKPRIEVSGVSR
jgi:hypothetical protein